MPAGWLIFFLFIIAPLPSYIIMISDQMEGVSIWEQLGFPWGTPLVLWVVITTLRPCLKITQCHHHIMFLLVMSHPQVAAFISCYALLGVWGAGGR